MKVSLNGALLAQTHTGSGQYVAQLIAHACDTELTVATPAGPLSDLGKLRWEQLTWPRQALRSGANLLHSPYFALPVRRRLPAVVTIHDLIPMILPAYRPSARVRAYTWLQALACRWADAIIVDSEHSKQDVLRLLRAPAERIHVVYLGVEPRFSPDRSGQSPLDEPYVFYIGGLDHRKNVPTLIRAFAQVVRERPELVLAIAGAPGANPATFPDPRPAAAALGDRVRFLGRVTDGEKLALYRHAELFVFPSLYEGFGLDPLEALACGCPVVCSDATSLPEIVGDAAVLTDARDPAKLARAMLEALADPEPLRAKGPPRAARFTWERTAEQTELIYRRVLSGVSASARPSPTQGGRPAPR